MSSIKKHKKNRHNRRKPVEQKRSFDGFFKLLKKTVLVFIFFGCVSAATYHGLKAFDQVASKPIARVEYSGELVYLEKEELEELFFPLQGKSLLQEELASVQETLLANPWLSEVSLFRQWPDTLRLELVEHKPIARWGDEGFVNHRGEIINVAAKEKLQHLPNLYGDTKDAYELMRQYRLLSGLFAEQQLSVTRLTRDKLGRWRLSLDNRWQLLFGREGLVEKTRHLMLAMEKGFLLKGDAIERIDMRYRNGFAVQWADDYLPDAENTEKLSSI